MSAPLRLVPLLALLLAPSCATTAPQATVILTSGRSIDLAGKEFVTAAKAFRTAHEQGAITEEQWRGWLAFATRYKATWTLVEDAWTAAATVEDYATAGRLYEALGALALELGKYIADVNAAMDAYKSSAGGAP